MSAVHNFSATDYDDALLRLLDLAVENNAIAVAINAGGTGYTVGDILTVSGGTPVSSLTLTLEVTSVAAGRGETDLLLMPGKEFQVADGLLTNFHLPRSSLLLLVAAFAGRREMLAAYEYAVSTHYRFFSYGDAPVLGLAR